MRYRRGVGNVPSHGGDRVLGKGRGILTESQARASALRSFGLRPSYQRIRIYDYLLTHRTHPTIDMIFQDLVKEIPGLSRTTIYSTLKSLTAAGAAQAITIEDHEIRYDADTSVHGHLKCVGCGIILDLHGVIPLDDLLALVPDGAQVDSLHLYVHGRCAACRKS